MNKLLTIKQQNRICIICGEEKDISNYHKHKVSKGGRKARCKTCILSAVIKVKDMSPAELIKFRERTRRNALKFYYLHRDKISAYRAKNVNEILRRRKLNPLYLEKKSVIYSRRRARKLGNGGKHTVDEWIILKNYFDNKCANCRSIEKLTKDHIIPISKGGTDDIENIQPLCRTCNGRKFTNTIKYEKQ